MIAYNSRNPKEFIDLGVKKPLTEKQAEEFADFIQSVVEESHKIHETLVIENTVSITKG